jgi:hypothetical protein
MKKLVLVAIWYRFFLPPSFLLQTLTNAVRRGRSTWASMSLFSR